MDDDDLFLTGEERESIIKKCEKMLIEHSEVYFDVFEFENLIDYYIEQNSLTKAFEVAAIASKQHPQSSNIEFRKAKIFLEKGNPKMALHLLSKIENYEKDNYEFELVKGFCFLDMNELSKAEHFFDHAVSLEDEFVDLPYQISSALINKEYHSLAIKYLKRAKHLDPLNQYILYDLAFCHEKVERYEDSIKYYKKFLDIDPYSDNAWYNLGIIYNKIEDYHEAINAFDYALAINDKNSAALFNKGNTLANWGKFELAIPVYSEFLAFEPDNMVALYYIGECYEKLENFDEALKYYKNVLAVDPMFSDAWHGIGIVKHYQDKNAEASGYLEKALEIDQDNAEYWYSFGNVNKALKGQENKALHCYKKATELDPLDVEFWISYADMQKLSSSVDQAVKTLEYASGFLEEDAELEFVLSAYYYQLGQLDKSLALFEEAKALDLELATVFFANCELKDEDRKHYTKLLIS